MEPEGVYPDRIDHYVGIGFRNGSNAFNFYATAL
jgi:hypothetical protein